MSGLTSSAFPFGFIGDATALVFVIDVRLGYSIDAASFVEFGVRIAVISQELPVVAVIHQRLHILIKLNYISHS